jgi:spermidine/putrescine transport system substrate-binding protein
MDEGSDELKILAPEGRRAAIQRDLTRRQAMTLALGGLAGAYLAGCGGSSGSGGGGGASATPSKLSASAKVESGPLIMANWADYTDPADYKRYTKAVGPEIKVEGFGSNDELIAKLNGGGAAYDIIVPSGGYVPEIAQKGWARPLQHDLIPNLKNLETKFTKNAFDPGNKHSVTKDYGITSFYYRTDVVKDPPDTLLGWFEAIPRYKGKSINFIEGAGETIPLALLALGLPSDSVKDADYEKALDLMLKAKPAISTINSTYIERLSRGQIDIGLGWNGDVARGIDAAAKKGIEIKMFIPQDRGWYWTDDWVIAAAGKNPVAAHKWINMVLDPKVAGTEWNYVGYPVPVVGADKHVDPAVAKNPVTNIDQSVLANYSTGIVTPELNAIQTKYYTRFRAQ